MNTIRLVAVLLLAALGNPASAAEPNEHSSSHAREVLVVPEPVRSEPVKPQSRHAKKTLSLLGRIGVDSAGMRSFIKDVDARIDNGYLRFGEEKLPMDGGKLTLRYRLSGSVDPILSHSNKHGIRRMELHYKPSETSRWEATATRKYVVVKYRIPLNEPER